MTVITNKYTLITGASEGFGKAMAFECGSKKMNLVLVALPEPALYFLAECIQRNYGVDVVPIGKDLLKENACEELFQQVQALHLPVNMLINNAGIGGTMLFEEESLLFYERQIRLNVLATTLITHLFLPMLKKNGPSYLLNVSSMNCFFYLAKKQVYGGTKSYVYSFSKSLHKELTSDGIHVSVICPGGMNTNVPLTILNKSLGRISRMSIMKPEAVAAIAIEGLLKRREVIIPGNINRLVLILDKLLPRFFLTLIATHQMKKMKCVTLISSR